METIREYALGQYRDTFKGSLKDTSVSLKDISLDMAKTLEEATYNYAKERYGLEEDDQDLLNTYKQIYIKVISNIKLNSNRDQVLAKIYNNEISLEDLPRLNREVLFPEKWSDLYQIRTDSVKQNVLKGLINVLDVIANIQHILKYRRRLQMNRALSK